MRFMGQAQQYSLCADDRGKGDDYIEVLAVIEMHDQASLRCKKWRNPLALKHSTCQSLKSAPTDPDAPSCTMNTVISQAKRASSLYLTNSQSKMSGRRVTLQSLVLAVQRHWLMDLLRQSLIHSQEYWYSKQGKVKLPPRQNSKHVVNTKLQRCLGLRRPREVRTVPHTKGKPLLCSFVGCEVSSQ